MIATKKVRVRTKEAYLIITAPLDCEVWRPGANVIIRWEYRGEKPEKFKIFRSYDDGKTWLVIGITGADRHWLQWAVPPEAKKEILIKVESVTAA